MQVKVRAIDVTRLVKEEGASFLANEVISVSDLRLGTEPNKHPTPGEHIPYSSLPHRHPSPLKVAKAPGSSHLTGFHDLDLDLNHVAFLLDKILHLLANQGHVSLW